MRILEVGVPTMDRKGFEVGVRVRVLGSSPQYPSYEGVIVRFEHQGKDVEKRVVAIVRDDRGREDWRPLGALRRC